MFSWNVLWSTVFVATVTPLLCAWYAEMMSAYAFFGTASDWFEPKETLPLALDPAPAPVVEVEVEVEPDPHAASAAKAAAPIVPMSIVRLLMGLEAKDERKADGTEPESGSEF